MTTPTLDALRPYLHHKRQCGVMGAYDPMPWRTGDHEACTCGLSAALASASAPQPQDYKALDDAAEMLWVVLANVSGGDWSKQSPEWQEAAARWRDNYFAAAGIRPSSAPAPRVFGCEICGRGVADGVALFRQNPTGERGIWRCGDHNQAPVDPDVRDIVMTIQRGNKEPR